MASENVRLLFDQVRTLALTPSLGTETYTNKLHQQYRSCSRKRSEYDKCARRRYCLLNGRNRLRFIFEDSTPRTLSMPKTNIRSSNLWLFTRTNLSTINPNKCPVKAKQPALSTLLRTNQFLGTFPVFTAVSRNERTNHRLPQKKQNTFPLFHVLFNSQNAIFIVPGIFRN